jgi:hypothetical protein
MQNKQKIIKNLQTKLFTHHHQTTHRQYLEWHQTLFIIIKNKFKPLNIQVCNFHINQKRRQLLRVIVIICFVSKITIHYIMDVDSTIYYLQFMHIHIVLDTFFT